MAIKTNNKKNQYFDIEIKTDIKYDRDKKPYITTMLDKYDNELQYSIIRLFSLELDSENNSLFENIKTYRNRKVYNTYRSAVSLSDKIMLTFRCLDIKNLEAVLNDALKIQDNIPFITSIDIW